MKTIANIITINSQNVKSEHLSAVIITEVTNTGLPKLPLDDLKSLRHHVV